MGKAEEYLAKKRNKAARRRLSNTVDFTKGVQAAKFRRKAGRRRMCEGMCYSLPTPEDPFNDLYKEKLARKKAKMAEGDGDHDLVNGTKGSKVELNQKTVKAKGSKTTRRKSSAESNKVEKPVYNASLSNNSEAKVSDDLGIASGLSNHALANGQKDALPGQWSSVERIKWKPSCENCSKNNNTWGCIGGDVFEVALCALLNANVINSEDHEGDIAIEQKMLLEKKCIGSKWDWLFWEACGSGSDVLATGRTADTLTYRSSIVAAVSHVGIRREHQIPFKDPLVLFLMRSKEQSLLVRSLFKVLKPLSGVHAVALHTQTPLQHQIEGLRSTEAEVLVASPERLYELLSVNAVSLTNISFMVIDGFEEMVSCGLSDSLFHIKARVADNVQTILLSGSSPHSTHFISQKLLKDPIYRVEANTHVPQCCACISQNVQVLVSEDKRQQKLKRVLRDHIESRENGATWGGLLVFFRHSQSLLHVKDLIQDEGYSVDMLCDDTSESNQSASHVLEQFRNGHVEVLLATEDYASQIDLAAIGVIVLYEFTASMNFYRQILMRMARYTINGVLYSFCSGATAPLASQLIDVLQQCIQPIPSSLRMLADAAQVVEQRQGS